MTKRIFDQFRFDKTGRPNCQVDKLDSINIKGRNLYLFINTKQKLKNKKQMQLEEANGPESKT